MITKILVWLPILYCLYKYFYSMYKDIYTSETEFFQSHTDYKNHLKKDTWDMESDDRDTYHDETYRHQQNIDEKSKGIYSYAPLIITAFLLFLIYKLYTQ